MDNLSRDMIYCRAAGYGCRYGAWKAAVEAGLVPIPGKTLPSGTNSESGPICEQCGNEILLVLGRNKNSRFCDNCNVERNRVRARERARRKKLEGKNNA